MFKEQPPEFRKIVQDLIDKLNREGFSASTITVTLLPIRAIYRRAIHRSEVTLNPTTGLEVDGIYDKDPKKYPDAVKYDQITFIDALRQRLNVMDSTAFSLCLDNNVPILVFNLNEPHIIRRAALGEKVGTLVRG